MNRDKQSQFVKDIVASDVKPIEPVFVDFQKEMTQKSYANGDEVLYKENTTNGTFMLQFRINHGSKADKELTTAADYFSYLGTDKLSPEELQKELYHLACNASVSVSSNVSVLSVSGLAENMPQALSLFINWIKNVQSDELVYENLVSDLLKARADAKHDQRTCFAKLRAFGQFGPLNENTNIMSASELAAADLRPSSASSPTCSITRRPSSIMVRSHWTSSRRKSTRNSPQPILLTVWKPTSIRHSLHRRTKSSSLRSMQRTST